MRKIPAQIALCAARGFAVCVCFWILPVLSPTKAAAQVAAEVKSLPGNALFCRPEGVAVGDSGNIIVADTYNHVIRRISPAGTVTLLAGQPNAYGSCDGTGATARFDYPEAVAVDQHGSIFVADSDNDTIRQITPAGEVSTLAGLPGMRGSADGAGRAARFSSPQGIALDRAGNIYVADAHNNTIRKVTSSGLVTTLAGRADCVGSTDGPSSEARFYNPQSVAVDLQGNIIVADRGNHIIRKITPSGAVTTLAGLAGCHGCADGTGHEARFFNPRGVAVDGVGNIYITDRGNQVIRMLSNDGKVTTVAGVPGCYGCVDGTGSNARFGFPTGIAVDGAGNLYVTDTLDNVIRRITPARMVTTAAGRLVRN